MTQAMHIFRKDIRHQRVDLALYLGLLVFLGCLIPTGWVGSWSSNDISTWLLSLVKVALPITWLVLIARLVHEEAIVGDRQFWTTRPYRWSSLLGAKLLFVAVCIALPYLVMQCALVVYGGLSPLNKGLLWDAGIHAIIVWIPMFLLAAVTATLTATFFTTLATTILWVAVLTIFIGAQGPEADAPFTRPLLAAIFTVIFFALLGSLYKQRRILQTRVLISVSAVLFILLIVFLSKMSPASLGTLLLTKQYRSQPLQYHLVYDPTTPHTAKGEGYGGMRYASLPIQLAGLTAGDRLDNAAVQFRLDAAGYHYAAPWRPATLGPDGLRLMVPNNVLERAGHADARLSVQLAADEIAPGETQTSLIQDHFAIPGGGACTAINPPYEGRSAETAVVCSYAFSVSQPVDIQPHMQPGCPSSMPSVHIRSRDAGTDMDPMMRWMINPHGRGPDCAVQSITTTVYHTINRFRTSVDIPSIRLADDLDQ